MPTSHIRIDERPLGFSLRGGIGFGLRRLTQTGAARCCSISCSICGMFARPSIRSTIRCSMTSTRDGSSSTANFSSSSGCSSASTRLTRRRSRSLRAMCARRLSMRRAGPEVERVKKTSMGNGSGSTAVRPPRCVRLRNYTAPFMHDLWLIGIAAGAGVASGLAAGGALARFDWAPAGAAVVALVLGGVLGWLIIDWRGGVAGAVAGLLSGFRARTLARNALRRGGTSAGTAVIFIVAGVLAFGVSLLPILGFVEAVAIPVVALRSRQRSDEKYAGLRTLAK